MVQGSDRERAAAVSVGNGSVAPAGRSGVPVDRHPSLRCLRGHYGEQVACKATMARNTADQSFSDSIPARKTPIEGEHKPTAKIDRVQIGILPRLLSSGFQPIVSKFCRKEIHGRNLHHIKKQEVSPGEGMDRTYRKKLLVRLDLQGMRAEFSAPISPASKVRNEAKKSEAAAAGSRRFHFGTERMGFRIRPCRYRAWAFPLLRRDGWHLV